MIFRTGEASSGVGMAGDDGGVFKKSISVSDCVSAGCIGWERRLMVLLLSSGMMLSELLPEGVSY